MRETRYGTCVKCDSCNGRFQIDERCMDREAEGDDVYCPYCGEETQA